MAWHCTRNRYIAAASSTLNEAHIQCSNHLIHNKQPPPHGGGIAISKFEYQQLNPPKIYIPVNVKTSLPRESKKKENIEILLLASRLFGGSKYVPSHISIYSNQCHNSLFFFFTHHHQTPSHRHKVQRTLRQTSCSPRTGKFPAVWNKNRST